MDILEKCVKRLLRSVARIPVKTVEPAVKKTKKHFARVKLVGRVRLNYMVNHQIPISLRS